MTQIDITKPLELSDGLTNRRYLHDRSHAATYYAKERRDLLAEAIRKWGIGGNHEVQEGR